MPAVETNHIDPRSTAMAGCGVASVNDANAWFHNPAALGFMGRGVIGGERAARVEVRSSSSDTASASSLSVSASASTSASTTSAEPGTEDPVELSLDPAAPEAACRLGQVDDESPSAGDDPAVAAAGAQAADAASEAVARYDAPFPASGKLDLGFYGQMRGQWGSSYSGIVGATAGAALRIGPFATGYRAFLQTAAYVQHYDTTYQGWVKSLNDVREWQHNLDAITAIQNGDPAGLAALTTGPTRYSEDFVDRAIVPNSMAVAEVPLAFGHAIDEHLALGGALKILYGRVYGGRSFLYPDAASLSSQSGIADAYLLSDFAIDDPMAWVGSYKSTWAVGLDLGAQCRYEGFTLGLHGRNLNRPRFHGYNEWKWAWIFTRPTGNNLIMPTIDPSSDFDGWMNSMLIESALLGSFGNLVQAVPTHFETGDVHLDPQLTVGLAYQIDQFTITGELECLRTETILPGQYNRYLRAGVEWVPGKVVALRAGVARNLVADDPTTEWSAGLGLNLFGAHADFGISASKRRFKVDDEKFPWTAAVSMGVGIGY